MPSCVRAGWSSCPSWQDAQTREPREPGRGNGPGSRQRPVLTRRGRCASRSPPVRLGSPVVPPSASRRGRGGREGAWQRIPEAAARGELCPSLGADAGPGGTERGVPGTWRRLGSGSAPDPPTSRGRSRDPNKGGRRIKGGGAVRSWVRAGNRDPQPAWLLRARNPGFPESTRSQQVRTQGQLQLGVRPPQPEIPSFPARCTLSTRPFSRGE